MKFLTCVTLSEAKGLGYDMEDFDKFLIGINDIGALDDLPRNRQGRALVGDPTSYRNVETAWMPVLPDARRGGGRSRLPDGTWATSGPARQEGPTPNGGLPVACPTELSSPSSAE